uniref:Conserved oligomeric Golgi complex subunit 4 n=1 Tax=Mesocestoides corti TaxID=53468 RepID=A0A5K3ESQ3_MESCO
MDIDVSQLKSIGELNKALLQLEDYENSLTEAINDFEEKRIEFDQKLRSLEESLPNMLDLNDKAVGLSAIVSNAASIGIQLSSKVRQLDVAKNRVQNVEALIGNIISLCKCVSDTSKALESNNVIEAAKSVSVFLSMDDQTLSLVESLEKEDVGVSILPTLRDLHRAVVSKFSSEFDDLISSKDVPRIEQLFRICPIIKEHNMGLLKYGKFVASEIGQKADIQLSLLVSVEPAKQPTMYVDLMTGLLESVAQAVQANESVIQESYGGDGLLRFIEIVQGECDRHAELIFMNFKEKNDLPVFLQRTRLELSVNCRSASTASSASGQQKQTPLCDYCLSTESLISDLVLFNARIELYLNFLRRRLLADPQQKNEKAHEVSADLRRFFNQCLLSKISQEIVDAYLPLEQLFLRELVNKAILLDELDESTKTFRLVDDVFFVVKKCLSRAISSGSVDAVCAMFNHADAVLTDQLIEDTLTARTKSCTSSGWIQQAYYLVHKRAGSGTLATGLLGTTNSEASSVASAGLSTAGSVANLDSQTQYLYALNSLEACLNCLFILQETLEQYIKEVFGLRRTSDLSKLQACLSDLIGSLSKAFRTLLDGAFDQLRAVIRPQVNSLTQSFNSVKRDISEEEFEQYAVNDPWVESLIVGLQGLLKPFHAALSVGNFEKFVSVLANELLLRLERFVQQKTYNRYGALQFDKEMRCIFNFFTSLSAFSCRETFARILQITKLLNLEKVEEVSYYGDTSNWRLSANEIRRLLTLRVDFKPEEIRRIHL